MENTPSPFNYVISHPGKFFLGVLKGFRENQGLLLAGAVAYYTLLSIIPMFALVLIVLSYFIETDILLQTLHSLLAMAISIRADVLIEHLESFLANWKVIGAVGFILLL